VRLLAAAISSPSSISVTRATCEGYTWNWSDVSSVDWYCLEVKESSGIYISPTICILNTTTSDGYVSINDLIAAPYSLEPGSKVYARASAWEGASQSITKETSTSGSNYLVDVPWGVVSTPTLTTNTATTLKISWSTLSTAVLVTGNSAIVNYVIEYSCATCATWMMLQN